MHKKLQTLRKIFRDYKRFINNIKETSLYHVYQEIYQIYRNFIRRYEQTFLKKIIARYKVKQLIINIQRQLRELLVIEAKKIRIKNYVFVKRVCVIEILFIFITSFLKKKCQRRETTISALTTLCRLQKSHNFCRKKNFLTIKSKREKTTQIIV